MTKQHSLCVVFLLLVPSCGEVEEVNEAPPILSQFYDPLMPPAEAPSLQVAAALLQQQMTESEILGEVLLTTLPASRRVIVRGTAVSSKDARLIATDHSGDPIDLAEILAAERSAHRARYGKLSPELGDELKGAPPESPIHVEISFHSDITPIDLPDAPQGESSTSFEEYILQQRQLRAVQARYRSCCARGISCSKGRV